MAVSSVTEASPTKELVLANIEQPTENLCQEVQWEPFFKVRPPRLSSSDLPQLTAFFCFSDEQVIKFGGVAFERTASGHFVSKDGQQLSNGAMGQIFGGFVSNGDLGGFGIIQNTQ